MTDRPRQKTDSPTGGFTLVELMVALVLIGIGIIALSGVQTRSSRDVYATGRQTRALALAEDKLETVRSLGYTGAVSDSGRQSVFNWTTRVDSADVDLKSVDVTVTWLDSSKPGNVHLQTLLSAR